MRSGRLEPHDLDAGPGRDGELVGRLEALAPQVGGEDPRAVAAHLGEAAVGVAVVHEPPRRAAPGRARRARSPAPSGTTRMTPSPPMPARRSASRAACSAVSSRTPSRSGTRTKSFSVPWPLVKAVWSAMRAIVPDRRAHQRQRLLGQVGGERVEPGDPRVGAEPRLLPAGEPSGQRGRLLLGLVARSACRRARPGPARSRAPGRPSGPRAAPAPRGARTSSSRPSLPHPVHPGRDPLVEARHAAYAGRATTVGCT